MTEVYRFSAGRSAAEALEIGGGKPVALGSISKRIKSSQAELEALNVRINVLKVIYLGKYYGCIQGPGMRYTYIITRRMPSKYISFELSCCVFSSATLGRASTGVGREPRHRPLLLVSYLDAITRDSAPQANWPGF